MKIIEKEYNIDTNKSVKESKIVSISDLHLSDETKIKQIYSWFMKELNQIRKTIVILGNHDLIRSKQNLEELGIEEKLMYFGGFKDSIFLNNSNYNDGNINFINYAKTMESYLKEWDDITYLYDDLGNLSVQLNGLINNDEYNILLSHSPVRLLNKFLLEEIELMKKIDLILAGHTHNGIVPHFMDNLIPYNKGLNFKFEVVDNIRNTKECKGVKMVINGGITKIDKYKPKLIKTLRPLYPAEIDIVKIKTK